MTFQAIETRYHGPTDTRGSRVSAVAHAGRVYVPYDDALSSEENHKAAARALAARVGWTADQFSKMHTGQLANGNYVHVFAEKGQENV